MMRTRIALAAAAGLLALAGCSETEAPTEPGDPATSAPAASAPATPAAPTQAADPSVTGNQVLSLGEACPAVVADVNTALGTVTEYVKNPLSGSVTVAELEQVRAELKVDELSAPEPLRGYLNAQVGVLNTAIEDLQNGGVGNVDVAKFQASGQQALALCENEVR